MSDDNRKQALDWAELEASESTLAITHALLYVGDVLADIHLELAGSNNAELAEAAPAASQSTLAPPLDDLEDEGETAPVVMRNGRVFTPAYDPRLWKMDAVTGEWISPKGRRFGPQTRQVLGVIRRLEVMRENGTLYTKPIHYPEPKTS